jgi:hypothetical protein
MIKLILWAEKSKLGTCLLSVKRTQSHLHLKQVADSAEKSFYESEYNHKRGPPERYRSQAAMPVFRTGRWFRWVDLGVVSVLLCRGVLRSVTLQPARPLENDVGLNVVFLECADAIKSGE